MNKKELQEFAQAAAKNSAKRVAAVCRSSVEIHSDPENENSWRAN